MTTRPTVSSVRQFPAPGARTVVNVYVNSLAVIALAPILVDRDGRGDERLATLLETGLITPVGRSALLGAGTDIDLSTWGVAVETAAPAGVEVKPIEVDLRLGSNAGVTLVLHRLHARVGHASVDIVPLPARWLRDQTREYADAVLKLGALGIIDEWSRLHRVAKLAAYRSIGIFPNLDRCFTDRDLDALNDSRIDPDEALALANIARHNSGRLLNAFRGLK